MTIAAGSGEAFLPLHIIQWPNHVNETPPFRKAIAKDPAVSLYNKPSLHINDPSK